MPDQPSAPISAAALCTAARYLATRYAQSGCPRVCRMVAQHFELIANHPDPALTECLRETCRRLQADWERIGAAREPERRQTAGAAAPLAANGTLH